jgi:transposase InsO family protein
MYPTEEWMLQMARNVVDLIDGALPQLRFALYDRGSKFRASCRDSLRSGGAQPLLLPPRSPNLEAFAERWIRSIKSECLSHLILFCEPSLRRALTEFLQHYHHERNHQSKTNLLLFPAPDAAKLRGGAPVQRRDHLGGLLKFYHRAAT